MLALLYFVTYSLLVAHCDDCYLDNTDYWFGNLQNTVTSTFQECKYICLDTDSCVGVVWYKAKSWPDPKGKCYLKDSLGGTNTCNYCILAKISCIKTEVCTIAAWNALNVENSVAPNGLPVRYETDVGVICKENYSSLTTIVRCNTNREFTYSEYKPSCQPECTTNSWNTLDIENSVTPAELPVKYLIAVQVQCKENYSSASATVTCSTNSQFTYTGNKPTCQSDCYLDNIDLLNGNIKTSFKATTLQMCKWECLKTAGCVAVTWYKTGGQQQDCYLKNSQFAAPSINTDSTSAKISCIKAEFVCETEIPYAKPTTTVTAIFGETVTVSCDTGYTLKGDNPITCNTGECESTCTAKFSSTPTCEPDCTTNSWTALDIEHSVSPDNLPVPYGTEVSVSCAENYNNTVAKVTCDPGGKFSYQGDKPVCYSDKTGSTSCEDCGVKAVPSDDISSDDKSSDDKGSYGKSSYGIPMQTVISITIGIIVILATLITVLIVLKLRRKPKTADPTIVAGNIRQNNAVVSSPVNDDSWFEITEYANDRTPDMGSVSPVNDDGQYNEVITHNVVHVPGSTTAYQNADRTPDMRSVSPVNDDGQYSDVITHSVVHVPGSTTAYQNADRTPDMRSVSPVNDDGQYNEVITHSVTHVPAEYQYAWTPEKGVRNGGTPPRFYANNEVDQ